MRLRTIALASLIALSPGCRTIQPKVEPLRSLELVNEPDSIIIKKYIKPMRNWQMTLVGFEIALKDIKKQFKQKVNEEKNLLDALIPRAKKEEKRIEGLETECKEKAVVLGRTVGRAVLMLELQRIQLLKLDKKFMVDVNLLLNYCRENLITVNQMVTIFEAAERGEAIIAAKDWAEFDKFPNLEIEDIRVAFDKKISELIVPIVDLETTIDNLKQTERTFETHKDMGCSE